MDYTQCLCLNPKRIQRIQVLDKLSGLSVLTRTSNIKDTGRERALLLYQAGPEVHEIFKSLPDTGDEKDYDSAVKALTTSFEPDKNKIYQTYKFHQAKQQDNETIDEFHTRLRRLAKHCNFPDVDFEIIMQKNIILFLKKHVD